MISPMPEHPFYERGRGGFDVFGLPLESSPEPCAHPSSQSLDGLGRKVLLLDAYSRCFD